MIDRERGIFIIHAFDLWCADVRVQSHCSDPMAYLKPYAIESFLQTIPINTPDERIVDLIIDYCYQQGGSLVPASKQVKYSIHSQSPRHLYIIGNGFDRYHGAACRYQDFRNYLYGCDSFTLSRFDLFFGPRSLENSFEHKWDWQICMEDKSARKYWHIPYPKAVWANKHLWWNFEQNLGMLNREKILNILDGNYSKRDKILDSLSMADFYWPLDEISEIVNRCSHEMQYHFHRWIRKLHYAKGYKRKMLTLDKNALFLNFNYTTFLETVYQIPKDQILYIHGCKDDKFGSLILGHNVNDQMAFDKWVYQNKNQRRFRPMLRNKRGRYYRNDRLAYLAYFLQDERRGNWLHPNRYYALDQADERLEEYTKKNVKPTRSIIYRNQGFFTSLGNVNQITIIGHSLSDVDMPYLEEVRNNVRDDTKWEISVCSKVDEQRAQYLFNVLHIPDGNGRIFRL